MKRNQVFHETLIPLLVEGIGAESYLELGTHGNETIGKVKCARRYGVDLHVGTPTDMALFEMTTDHFLEHFAAAYSPYDFVFIDADHAAEQVKKDFLGVWPHVSPEGLVALHDSNPETAKDAEPGYCGNAWEFAEWLHHRNYEAMTLPYCPGLTIVRKRCVWGPTG